MNQEADPKAWIGRQETIDEVATLPTIVRLGATLAQPVLQGDVSELPPLSHWLYFLPATSTVDLKSDGHPKMGVFLPPITLPRRMWAGSRVAFHAPIRIGDAMTRRSTIADVSQKDGKSGSLVFITVKHEVLVDGTAAIVEEQDLVYREAATAGASAVKSDPSHYEAQWRKRIDPSPMLLFRFSALTFNSHRIHYDKPYAQEEEGYPDLVVHGPLLATLLAHSVNQEIPGARLTRFDFRAVRPLFANEPFYICGAREAESTVRLWAEAADGSVATSATANIEVHTGA